MNSFNKRNGEQPTETWRIDLKSRICVMASIIYGTSDPEEMTPKKAVDLAAEIEDLANEKVMTMKRDRPIPRRTNYTPVI